MDQKKFEAMNDQEKLDTLGGMTIENEFKSLGWKGIPKEFYLHSMKVISKSGSTLEMSAALTLGQLRKVLKIKADVET